MMNSYTPKEGSEGQITLALLKDLQRKLATNDQRIAELQEQLGSTKLSLIRTTDSRESVADNRFRGGITEAEGSSQYHGTRSKTTAGRSGVETGRLPDIEEQMVQTT
ncbi:MAG: hypothetical protein IPO05_18315 [Flavobacteriales bacterium]|nr:hypothetical protein [Flavobacteriales bacterium]